MLTCQKESKKYDMGIEKFFDILEEVKKEEQTTIETLFDSEWC